jgi:hypothetical protein
VRLKNNMNRAVVNVSDGHYHRGQVRLLLALDEFDPFSRRFFWSEIPKSWPKHTEKPYAFKAYALDWANEFADVLLWCDSSVYPIRSMEPLWEKIERDGVWIGLNGWTNYEWTADSAYADLFPGTPIEEARAVSKTFPHAIATAFGLNVKSKIGRALFDEYYRLADTNAFCGPWSNANYPGAIQHPSISPCGAADVRGHRHDQTALSVIAWRLGIELTPCPEFFSYAPGTEKTILLCEGA